MTAAGLRRAGRVLLLLLVAAGSVAAWRWRAVLDPAALIEWIRRAPAAPLVFLGLHLAASLLFVPRTLLAAVSGVLFGMWMGVLWAALGSVIGAIAGFLVARHAHAGLIDRAAWARLDALLARVERGGWRIVALIRLAPVIPHSLTNYALGMTRLRLAPYVFGSLLGQLPLTVAYVDLGAGGSRAALGGADWLVPSAIGATVLALSALVPLAARRYLRAARPAPAE